MKIVAMIGGIGVVWALVYVIAELHYDVRAIRKLLEGRNQK